MVSQLLNLLKIRTREIILSNMNTLERLTREIRLSRFLYKMPIGNKQSFIKG